LFDKILKIPVIVLLTGRFVGILHKTSLLTEICNIMISEPLQF
jgi:Mg2+/citrate symporter